jgi:hypothetical protein
MGHHPATDEAARMTATVETLVSKRVISFDP